MSGLNAIMDNSLSALLAAQAGLATTGHNIANAHTPGFNRQDVIFGTRQPEVLAYGAIGRGVEVMGIRRIQDEFLLGNLRAQTSRLHSYAAVDTALYDIEGILGSVDNDHLGDALNNFFEAWNDLAQPPFNSSLKMNVVAKAETLVTDFRAIDEALQRLQADLELRIQAETENLNRLLQDIGELNRQVMMAETNGHPANDLRDQRDLKITQLSELAEVSVLERDDGSKDIILAGRTMVARDRVTQFEGIYRPDGDSYTFAVVTEGNQQDVALSPGRLEGLLAARDIHIREVREQLDSVARQLITEVNELHTQGLAAGGRGVMFFTGDSMHTIGVNEALVNNETLVATGRTGTAADNDISLALADLGRNSFYGSARKSVSESYRSVITDVAGNLGSFEFMVENQQSVVASLSARMASVSGVSLDEEGANLVRYQNSYNAAAKVIATVQEMYDTLLNIV
jgi:flagellar hook-associated protein 1 FlgK